MEEDRHLTDIHGRPLCKGDRVLYVEHSRGPDPKLTEGTVTDLDPGKKEVKVRHYDRYKYDLKTCEHGGWSEGRLKWNQRRFYIRDDIKERQLGTLIRQAEAVLAADTDPKDILARAMGSNCERGLLACADSLRVVLEYMVSTLKRYVEE
jgi:hypothetical protein